MESVYLYAIKKPDVKLNIRIQKLLRLYFIC